MSMSVISAAAAQQLNKKVQQSIDPRLFLFCNYEPTVSYAISEDGKFLTAVQDLYKFAIDSNCIIKNYKDFIPSSDWGQFNRLRELLDQISILRAVTDHNQSIKNGKVEQEQLESYMAWIERILHKPAPDSQQDFTILNQALAGIASELIQLVEKFISHVNVNPNKAGIVKEWIDHTLRWYSSNTKTEIYKGQLMNAYVANANASGNNRPDLYRIHSLKRKIAKWIEAALYYPIDNELREVEREIASAEGMLEGTSAMYQVLRAKMPTDKLMVFEASLRQGVAQNTQKRESILQRREILENQIAGKHVDFFFRHLEEHLRSTIAKLDCNGVSYTLLPQDLLQEDIELFFGGVPSPEADF